jgi:phi13 family phage major tail protein
MSEFGRVCTGFSLPWVAKYAASAGVVTYSLAQRLARGVSVNVSANSSSDNKFYVDNQVGESADGVFTDGTVELVVDGLLDSARKLIYGLPTADSDGWMNEGDSAVAPYMGVGFVARFMSGGVTTYVPYVLTKTKFAVEGTEAKTQEAEKEWQTQTLTANLFRDDTSNHTWRKIGEECQTEAAAEQMIKTLFNVSSSTTTVTTE